MHTYRVPNGWQPLWWEPVLWHGSDWTFTARLTGLAPGAIEGGTIYFDGKGFPATVKNDVLTAVVTFDEWKGAKEGGAAEAFLHTAAGTVLWMRGRIVLGGYR